MKTLRGLFPTILFTLSLLVGLCPSFCIAQVQVGTTTAEDGTGDTAQRKLFTATSGEQWALFFNGSGIEYVSSSDGMVWGSRGTLLYATSDFSLSFKSISGTDYLFVAIRSGFDVVVRRGIVSAGAIAFDAEVVVLDGSSMSNAYQAPSVAVSANNHLWVAGILVGDPGASNEFKQVVARRSTSSATGDISSWQVAALLGKADKSTRSVVMLPRTGDGMYLIVNGLSQNIVGFMYDGVTWSDGNSGGNFSWFTFPGDGLNAFVRVLLTSGENLYVGGGFTDAGGNTQADSIAMWNGAAWVGLGASALNNPVYTFSLSGTTLYAGGLFTDAGGNTQADGIALWNGTAWASLGASGINNAVYNLSLTGTTLYAGGLFTDAGGNNQADGIAVWNGMTWAALGSSGMSNAVYSLLSSGATLYAGGVIQQRRRK